MKELQTLGNEFSRLQESLRSHEAEASKHGGQSQPGPDPEITKALQFVSSENDDLTGFCNVAKKDLAAFKKRFKSLSVQVSEMVGGLDALARYSYSFNVKLWAFQRLIGKESCHIAGKSLKWTRQPLVLMGNS